MQKLTLLFSDTELGEGNVTDDFIEEDLLLEAIKKNFHYGELYPLDFVFNGDTFDFLKAPYKGKYPRHITEEVSLWKLAKIQQAHPRFFEILGQCLKTNPQSRIIFIHGNHDLEIEFQKVKDQIKNYITDQEKEQERILFPGFEFTSGPIFIEHGSQMDDVFKVIPEKLILKTKKNAELLLITPWIYSLNFERWLKIKERYPFIERLNPRAKTIGLLPLGLKKKVYFDPVLYMVKGFSYTQWVHRRDPTRKFPLEEFKRYVRLLLEGEFELKIDQKLKEKIQKSEYKIFAVGHTHRPLLKKIEGKYMINTGSWRDEYQLEEEKGLYLPRPKSYGFILHDEKDVKVIKLLKKKSLQKPILVKDLLMYTRQKRRLHERIKRKVKQLKSKEKVLEVNPQVKELIITRNAPRKVFKIKRL